MSKLSSTLYKAYHWLAGLPPKIYWHNQHKITEQEKDELAALFASGYYIILTGNKYRLSSIIVSFLSWVKTGKWAKYTHVLMNCDNITQPDQRASYKFVEADVKGVVFTTFDRVTDCSSICVLTPKNIQNEEWTRVIDALLRELGKPYDDLFDLADQTKSSCVEVVLNALKAAEYSEDFKNLDLMITHVGNLVPQMYRDCPDFKVELER